MGSRRGAFASDGFKVANDIREHAAQVSEAGQRYAKALFDLARERDQVGAVEADLNSLDAACRDSPEFRRLLASPVFNAEDKARGLAALAAAGAFADTTRKFLALLARNRRAADLPDVARAYRRLSAKHRGVVGAEIVTAVPLTDTQGEQIAAALRSSLGKSPEITTRVDPSILGGLRVRVGSRLYDASLKSRLDGLKYALKRA